ncbi:unnamed protein product, partial [Trypanosoma congolense IL3000]
MTHGHDPPSHSPPSICGRGRRAGRFVRLHEAIAASRVAHGSGVGARAWLPPVVAEENVRPTELPRVRAEVHRGGQPKRDLLQLPSFTNIVFDTSSLLRMSAADFVNLLSSSVIHIPLVVQREFLLKSRLYRGFDARRCRSTLRCWISGSRTHNGLRLQQGRPRSIHDACTNATVSDDQILLFALHIQEEDPFRPLVVLTEDKFLTLKARNEKLVVHTVESYAASLTSQRGSRSAAL